MMMIMMILIAVEVGLEVGTLKPDDIEAIFILLFSFLFYNL